MSMQPVEINTQELMNEFVKVLGQLQAELIVKRLELAKLYERLGAAGQANPASVREENNGSQISGG